MATTDVNRHIHMRHKLVGSTFDDGTTVSRSIRYLEESFPIILMVLVKRQSKSEKGMRFDQR